MVSCQYSLKTKVRFCRFSHPQSHTTTDTNRNHSNNSRKIKGQTAEKKITGSRQGVDWIWIKTTTTPTPTQQQHLLLITVNEYVWIVAIQKKRDEGEGWKTLSKGSGTQSQKGRLFGDANSFFFAAKDVEFFIKIKWK